MDAYQLLADLVNTLNGENAPDQLGGYLDHLVSYNVHLAALHLPLFVAVGEEE